MGNQMDLLDHVFRRHDPREVPPSWSNELEGLTPLPRVETKCMFIGCEYLVLVHKINYWFLAVFYEFVMDGNEGRQCWIVLAEHLFSYGSKQTNFDL